MSKNSHEVLDLIYALIVTQKSKKGGKDLETIQLITTPDPGYHMRK